MKAENRREKQREERAGKDERVLREGKEKTPKTDREKAKVEEKSSKDDKAKAGNGEPMELSRERDAIKETKSKEKGDRVAVVGSLKSPALRSESAERGECSHGRSVFFFCCDWTNGGRQTYMFPPPISVPVDHKRRKLDSHSSPSHSSTVKVSMA